MSLEIKKQTASYTKYRDYLYSMIPNMDADIIVTIDLDNDNVLCDIRREFKNSHIYYIEKSRNSQYLSKVQNSTHISFDDDKFFEKKETLIASKKSCKLKSIKGKSRFEKMLDKIKKENKGKRIQILGNPPFSKGGKIWDICRKITTNIAWIMPLGQYKVNNRYKYINTSKKIDEKLFNGAKIGDNNLLITTCKETPNESITYEDLIYKFSNDNFKPYYKWNREHFIGLSVLQTTNKNSLDFNRDTDFLTSNRGCNNDNYFATIDGMDYIYNMTNDSVELNSGLSLIRFGNPTSKKNFCIWSYNNEKRDKRLINRIIKGLHLISSGNLCNMAIPQIDWESISDHPFWKEGNYDEAVLDVMNLKPVYDDNHSIIGVESK